MLWTRVFVVSALEKAIVAGLSAFAGSLDFTSGQPSVHGVIAGAVAAGLTALYAFTKQLGGVQATPVPPAK